MLAHGSPLSLTLRDRPPCSIGVNESNKAFGQVREKLQLADVQWLTQELKEEEVPTIRKGRPQSTKEKAEITGGIRQKWKPRVIERSRKLDRARAQRSNISQSLVEFDGCAHPDLLERDHAIAASVHPDAGARLRSSRTGLSSLRHVSPEARVYSMQHLPIGLGSVVGACGRRPEKPEGAQIALALAGNAGHALGMKAVGIHTEEHRADRHAGALVIALRIRVDRDRFGIDPLQVMLNTLLGEALGHALQQAVAAVNLENHGLAPFGDLGSRPSLKSKMTDDPAWPSRATTGMSS